MSMLSMAASRRADRIREKDAYLIPYLLGWCGRGPDQPWGAAHSFALEMGASYGVIRGESDPTPTEMGRLVADIFASAGEAGTAKTEGLGPKDEHAAPEGGDAQ
jgi:hypothetical protein